MHDVALNPQFKRTSATAIGLRDSAITTVALPEITLTTDLAVLDGGTGASTAANARTNLSAAALGANSDITSLAGLTTALTVAQGGTGIATATAYAVICAGTTATGPFQVLAALGSSGNVLTSNGAGALPSFQAASASTHAILSATHTDSLAASVVLGDVIHGNSTPAWARLAGNTTTAKQYLSQTGDGTISAVPSWATMAEADIADGSTFPRLAATETITGIWTYQNYLYMDTSDDLLDATTFFMKKYRSSGAGNAIVAYRYRGSRATPSATLSSDAIFSFVMHGYDGSGTPYGATFECVAEGDFSGTSSPMRWGWNTCPSGSWNTSTERMRVDNAGVVYFYSLATAAASTDLNINASNQLHKVSSSRQYKNNIRSLKIDSSLIYQLQPKTFEWNEKTLDNGKTDFGLIAEEVALVLPQLVSYLPDYQEVPTEYHKDGKVKSKKVEAIPNSEKPNSIKYQMLSVLLLNEVKKLRAEVDALKIK